MALQRKHRWYTIRVVYSDTLSMKEKEMENSLFVEQLEAHVIDIIQTGLNNQTLSLERASELSRITLSCLYPSIGKDHLLLAREIFLKIPELIPIAEEIEKRISEIQ
jgi:hypothetical protein